MIKQRPYGVPEGYFSELQMNLQEIPQQESSRAMTVTPMMRFKPYLALAAVFAFAMLVGSLINKHVPTEDTYTYEQLCYSDLILASDPYQIYDTYSYEEEEYSEDDILNYLIDTNTSLAEIEYLLTQY